MGRSRYVFGIPTTLGDRIWTEGVGDLGYDEKFWIDSFTTTNLSSYLEIDPSYQVPEYAAKSSELFRIIETKTDADGREFRVVQPIREFSAKLCGHLRSDKDAFLWAWLTNEEMNMLKPLVYGYHRKTLFMDLPNVLGDIDEIYVRAFDQFESICDSYAQQSIHVKSAVRALEEVFTDNVRLEFVKDSDTLPSHRFLQFVTNFDKFMMSSDDEVVAIKYYVDLTNTLCTEHRLKILPEYDVSFLNNRHLIGQSLMLDRLRDLTIQHQVYFTPNDFLVGLLNSPTGILPKIYTDAHLLKTYKEKK